METLRKTLARKNTCQGSKLSKMKRMCVPLQRYFKSLLRRNLDHNKYLTRQAMYVLLRLVFPGKAVSIIYFSACARAWMRAWMRACGFASACNLSYPACQAHARYYNHLWPFWFHHIFWHYLINGEIRRKITEYKMYILIFSTTFVWNISHSKKNSARYFQKCKKSSYKVSVILARF